MRDGLVGRAPDQREHLDADLVPALLREERLAEEHAHLDPIGSEEQQAATDDDRLRVPPLGDEALGLGRSFVRHRPRQLIKVRAVLPEKAGSASAC